jgi:hypothetical protein
MFMVILVVTLAASAAILAYLPVPFLLIELLWAGVLCALAIKHKHSSLRAVWFNLAAVVIALGALELYFHSREVERMAGSHTEGYYEEHKLLGYCPAAGRKSRAIKYHGDELVYDVNYHIDRRGLRVSPPLQEQPTCGGILFFGGSFTFGEGVEDHQTMPYLTGVRTDGRYVIDNFGFHGYGPHQMLAALEMGIVDEIVGESVSYVIYQGIPAHVARSAGRVKWDRHGPKFILNSNGKPVYSGHFDDELTHSIRWLRKQLDKSALYRWSVSQLREATTEEIALYTAIVAAARNAVNRKFPDAEFHVLLWGSQRDKSYDAIISGLRKANINVHSINKILPGYKQEPEAYEISPFDKHPNPRAHEQIATYVSTRILHGDSCQNPGLLATATAR